MKPHDPKAVHAVQRSAFDTSRISIIVQANHVLALSHWARAARAWAKKQPQEAGSELKAAAQHAEHAASWLGGELAGVRAAAAEAAAVGDKLATGASCTREEINNASTALNDAIDAVGKQIGSPHKAVPFDHTIII
jgi:hypothetical protein